MLTVDIVIERIKTILRINSRKLEKKIGICRVYKIHADICVPEKRKLHT